MSSLPTTLKRQTGRPRRITLDQVIEAACEIGLDKVEMVSVAQSLNIGVATLYGYVQDREHLVRLVADRLSRRGIVEDHGQNWDEALREHAASSYAVYRMWPQLIGHLMDGFLGTLADSEHSDAVLKLLIARGVTPADALMLFFQTNQAVAGAAVGAAYYERLREAHGGDAGLDRTVRAGCEQHGYYALRQCLDSGGIKHLLDDYTPALERLIKEQKQKMENAQGI